MQVPVIIRHHSIYTNKPVEYSESEEAGQKQSRGGSPKVQLDCIETYATIFGHK